MLQHALPCLVIPEKSRPAIGTSPGLKPSPFPAYSPNLNPIERLWKLLKAEWFSDFVAKSHEALLARIDQALLWVIGRGDANTLTCRIKTKL